MRRISILLVIAFLNTLFASVYLNTARIAYFNERDYERAKKACIEGIQKGERNFEFHAILGGSEIGLGNWLDAARALENAFLTDTTKTLDWMVNKGGGKEYYYQAFYFSARLKFNEEAYQDVVMYLEYGKLLNPSDVNTYILRGAALYKLDKVAEANREYNKVLDIDPYNPDVYFLIGKSLFEAKAFDSSLSYFSNATVYYKRQYDRHEQIVFQNLAEISPELVQDILKLWAAEQLQELDHIIKTQLELAEGLDVHQQSFKNFNKSATDLARSLYFAGMAYYYLGKDSLALLKLKESLQYKPDDIDALYYTGELHVRQKEYTDGADYFKRVTALKKDDVYAWFYLGVCYMQLKEYEKAIDVYENKVLVLNPEHSDAMTNLAFIYSELGNTKKSLEYLKKAEDLMNE